MMSVEITGADEMVRMRAKCFVRRETGCARRSGNFGDNGAVVSQQTVEKTRFADIRATDEGNLQTFS